MSKFFQQKERSPFTYSVIETRRKRSNYSGWIVGGVISAILVGGIYMLFR